VGSNAGKGRSRNGVKPNSSPGPKNRGKVRWCPSTCCSGGNTSHHI
jgi:hypothetical protein